MKGCAGQRGDQIFDEWPAGAAGGQSGNDTGDRFQNTDGDGADHRDDQHEQQDRKAVIAGQGPASLERLDGIALPFIDDHHRHEKQSGAQVQPGNDEQDESWQSDNGNQQIGDQINHEYFQRTDKIFRHGTVARWGKGKIDRQTAEADHQIGCNDRQRMFIKIGGIDGDDSIHVFIAIKYRRRDILRE